MPATEMSHKPQPHAALGESAGGRESEGQGVHAQPLGYGDPGEDTVPNEVTEAIIEEEEEAPGEAEPLRAAPSPSMPSATEVEEHRLTHYPYRDWCDYCVRARGLGEQHRRSKHERRIPIVGLDYW